jgi:hypothetical protein
MEGRGRGFFLSLLPTLRSSSHIHINLLFSLRFLPYLRLLLPQPSLFLLILFLSFPSAFPLPLSLLLFPQPSSFSSAFCFFLRLLLFPQPSAFSSAFRFFLSLLLFPQPFAFSSAFRFFLSLLLFLQPSPFSSAFFPFLVPYSRPLPLFFRISLFL